MAYDFNMQMNMQGPSGANISRVKKQIEAGLGGINIGGLDTKGFAKANSEIDKTRNNLKKGEKASKSFFQALTGRAANYATFTAISTAVLKLTGAVSQATREAIKYETELIKISQVTGDTISRTKEYGKELLNISKTYNVNITKIAQLTRTLTQTGLSFREASKGAELLARTSLLASFDNLTSTTEGLIAVMQTFNLTVTSSAKVLEEINIVSKRFAVESGDIVEAIRRTGGAFSAAGGNVEELIALFTSVRSTSRESAETIATGFRTIFGRLQRPKTIEYFKELGIQLQTAEGQFVGPYEAIKRISEGLDRLGISAGSVQFAQVVEQIGGIRQLSKVVPLLEQFNKSQRALDLQNKASAESTKDIEKAQQGLGFQLGALRQEFGALIAEFVDSSSFKFLAETFISIARTVIRLTASFKPLLPILATLTAFKIGKGLGTLLSGGFSLKGLKDAAVAPKGFARGGIVPGSGNGDTVPAMLTPGEFVVRKSAVQAFGAGNLGKINRYADGGEIIYDRPQRDGIAEDTLNAGMAKAVNDLAKSMNEDSKQVRGTIKNIPQYESVVGILFEAALSRASGGKFSDDDDPLKPFDFPDGLKNSYFNLVGRGSMITDAKKRKSGGANGKTEKNIKSKIARFLSADGRRLQPGKRNFGVALMEQGSDERSTWSLDELGIQGKNTGGSISGAGTDTVPALLTPGEFVVNKKSAQAYGYGNLKKINKYAKGGIVQRFADGGEVDPRADRISELLRATDQRDVRGRIDTSDPQAVQDQIQLLMELVKLAKDSRREYHPDQLDNRPLFDAAQRANDIARERLTVMEEMADSLAAAGGGGGDGGGDAGGDAGGAGPAGAAGGLIVAKKAEAEATELATMKVEGLVEEASKAGYALTKVEQSGKKAADAQDKAAEAAEKLSLNSAQVIFGFAAFTSSLKNFLGVNLNQEALDAAQVKAGKFGGASDILKRLDEDKIKGFGSTLNQVSNQLNKGKFGNIGKKFAGPLKKTAGVLLKDGAKLAKGTKMLARGLDISMYAELIGGFVDSLFSQDYGKQKERAIEMGDAQAAGTAALNEYNQSMLRGIPVIGGFLAGFQSFLPVWETSIGGVVKSTAEMQASVVALDKAMVSSGKKINDALIRGSSEEFKAAYSEGSAALADTQSKIDTTKTKLAGASAGGEAGISLASGAAAGALTGAAIGSFVPIIGTGIGALVGGVIGGAMALSSSLGKSHEVIMKGYEEAGKAVEAHGQAYRDRLAQVSNEMTSAAVNVIAAGGSFEDAFARLKDQFGEEAFNDMFDGVDVKTAADLETVYQNQKAKAEEAAAAIEKQNQAIAKQAEEVESKWEPAWYNLYLGGKNASKQAQANLELQKKEIEEKKKEAEQRKTAIAQMQQAMAQQAALNKERQIEAERIRTIIELNRAWQKSQDSINKTLYEFSNLSDKFSKVGTGQLTNEDALAGTGISATTMQMSGEEILRDSTAFEEMMQSINRTAAANNLGTGRQDFLRRTQNEFKAIDQLESQLLAGGDLTQLVLDAQDAAKKSVTSEDGKEIDQSIAQTANDKLKDELKKQLAANLNLDVSELGTELDAAMLLYAQKLSSDLDPTVAADAVKKQLGEAAAQFFEEQKKNIEELQKKRQELQDMELKLAAKRVADAKQLYDIQKESSMKMASFIKESQDFFDVDTTARGRRRSAARNVQFAGEQAARVTQARRSFGSQQGVSLPSSFAAMLGFGGPAEKEIAVDVAAIVADAKKLKQVGPEYLNIINDQIDAEKTKLDALREQAVAQREATQALRDAQGDLVNQFAFGTDEQRGDLLRSANAAQMAASQGSLAGLSGEMRGEVSSFLDRFSDVSLSQFGGRTGAEVKGDIAAEEAVRAGLISRSQKADFAAKAARKAVPIDQKLAEGIKNQEEVIKSLFESEEVLREAQLKQEVQNTQEMATIVNKFGEHVETLGKQLGQDLSDAIAGSMNIETNIRGLDEQKAAKQNVLDQKQQAAAIEKARGEALDAEQSRLFDERGQAERQRAAINEDFEQRLIDAGLIEANELGDFEKLGISAGARAGQFKFKQRTLESGPRTEEQQKLIKEYRDAFEVAGKKRFDAQQAIDLKQKEIDAQQKIVNEANTQVTKAQGQLDAANQRLTQERQRLDDYNESIAAEEEKQAAPQAASQPQTPIPSASPGTRVAPATASPPPSVTELAPSVTTPAGGSPVEQIPKFEITGSQQITIAMPDVQAAFSKEITGMVYSAVASVFKTAADKIDNSTSPREVVSALQDAANTTQTVPV